MIAEKIHLIMSLFAALAVAIVGIICKTPVMELSIRIIVVIIVFFILGLFLRAVFMKNKKPALDEDEYEGSEG